MSDNNSHIRIYERSPLYQLLISLLIVLGVGILFFTVSLFAGKFIFHADLGLLEDPSSAVSSSDIAFLKYIVISQEFSLFIVPAIIILTNMKAAHQSNLTIFRIPRVHEIGLVILLAFCIFPITGITGELNSRMHLPHWLSGLEQWMVEKEDYAARLEDILMAPDTFGVMLFNVFMIAVIPAIGEELIFRGVFQKILSDLFRSGHLAVWVTAFVFSAIHFRFFGFVPRFILGLVFGYLFLWSGTLWLPVISHFVNNAVSVIAAYIQGLDGVNAPPDVPLGKQLIGLTLPIIISLVILLYFRNNNRKKAETSRNQSQPANS